MNSVTNIIDYTKNCISGISSDGIEKWTSIVALAILGLFAIILVFKMIRGYSSGSRRQVLSTGTILTAVIASMILTRKASSLLLTFVTEDNIESAMSTLLGSSEQTSSYVNILSELPFETVQYILSVPIAILLSPILFLVIYGIVKLVLSLVQKLIGAKEKAGGPKNGLERFSGLCLATAEAVLVFSIFILPATCIISFADEVVATAASSDHIAENEEDGDFAEFAAAYIDYIDPIVAQSPVLTFANISTNAPLVRTISKVPKVENVDLREEFFDVVDIMLVDIPEVGKINLKEPKEEDKESVSALIDKFASNTIITTVVSNTVSSAATMIDTKTLGLNIDPPYDVIVDDVLAILAGCTAKTLKEDLHLIKDVYFLLADEKVLTNISNSDALLESLTAKREGESKSVVQKVIDILNRNERTKALVTTLTKLSLTILSEEIGNGAEAAETYDNLKDSMNDVLSVKNDYFRNEEEYKEALTDTLDTSLKENNIILEREIVEKIADYIDTAYPDATEFSDEEFNDVLLSYFDAYLEYQNTGEIPDDIILPPGFDTDDIPDDVPPGYYNFEKVPEDVLPDYDSDGTPNYYEEETPEDEDNIEIDGWTIIK